MTIDLVDLTYHTTEKINETYRIDAFALRDGNYVRVARKTERSSASVNLNGKKKTVTIEATEPIARIRLTPTTNVVGWGIAFDNVCTAK